MSQVSLFASLCPLPLGDLTHGPRGSWSSKHQKQSSFPSGTISACTRASGLCTGTYVHPTAQTRNLGPFLLLRFTSPCPHVHMKPTPNTCHFYLPNLSSTLFISAALTLD